MSTTKAPDLSSLTDDQLGRARLVAQRTVNVGARDGHFGRVTREEGIRRLDAVRAGIASQAADTATEIVRQLAKSGDTIPVAELARYAGLFALTDPAHPAWGALAAEVAAPDRLDRGTNWSTDTDAERDGEQSERRNALEAARARLPELTAETERRRQVVEDELEAERLESHRARQRVQS